MRILIFSLLVFGICLQARADSEVITSAFRFSLPSEWAMKPRPQVPAALLRLRVPDCEYTTDKYERNEDALFVRWDANTTFDSDYSDGGLGPSTPNAQYEQVIMEWQQEIQENKIIEPKIIHLNANAPVKKIVRATAWLPQLKKQRTMILVLRDDGIAQIDLLVNIISQKENDLIRHVIERLEANTDSMSVPPCPFKGTGSPELWSKRKPRPR